MWRYRKLWRLVAHLHSCRPLKQHWPCQLKKTDGSFKHSSERGGTGRLALTGLRKIPSIRILAGKYWWQAWRISFYHENIHFNLLVRLLKRQVWHTGACGCASPAHTGIYLLEVSYEKSKEITDLINQGGLFEKARLGAMVSSPYYATEEVHFFIFALQEFLPIWKMETDYKNYYSRTKRVHHKSDDPCDRSWGERVV